MLAQLYPAEKLQRILIPREGWKPFHGVADREAWDGLPGPLRQAHISRGARALACEWPSLPASLFLDYVRTGNRTRYQQARDRRRSALCDLVVAECMEASSRFLDDIANGIWCTCEETYWGVPAHIHMQAAGPGLPDVAEPTVDLFAAETSALLAWTDYLLGSRLDEVSPLIRPRIRREAERRILTPCLEREDFWWMGFERERGRVNNWNPWINSNWLTTTLLLESDEAKRTAAVAKILQSLDFFVDPYPEDGGCDEGPSYWGRAGASLFDCLELLYSATGGSIDVYDQSLIQEIGRYIYRAFIAERYFLNFADAPALVSLPASLVFRYGRRIDDEQMVGLGAFAAQQQGLADRAVGDSIGRQLPSLFGIRELLEAEPEQPLLRDVWLPVIEVMASRDAAGSSRGLYVAAKGGHNAESHNHNDIGNFVVYTDGKAVIVDAGVEAYTARTFSSERYQIWTMQSGYHSLPTVAGAAQAPGAEHAARDVRWESDDDKTRLELDIAGAYPPEAKLSSWVRTITHVRGQHVEIVDEYELSEPCGEITMSLVTPCTVAVGSAGQILLEPVQLSDGRSAGAARIQCEACLAAEVEDIPLTDARMKTTWAGLSRIVLRSANPPLRGRWVLRIAPRE